MLFPTFLTLYFYLFCFAIVLFFTFFFLLYFSHLVITLRVDRLIFSIGESVLIFIDAFARSEFDIDRRPFESKYRTDLVLDISGIGEVEVSRVID